MVSVCVFGSFLVMYYSRDGIFWSTIDEWVGTFFIFVLAMVQIILFSWVWGVDKGFEEAHQGALIRIPSFYRIIMKYVTPTYLIVIFGFFCVQNLPSWIQAVLDEPLRQGAILLILATTALIVVCARIGAKRWAAAGLDIDGREPARD
jgi:NSS family neurotransmitter:Na+ symporter